MTAVVWLDGSGEADRASVGGKAAGLAAMLGAGLPVPPAFAVTVEAFEAALGPSLRDRIDAVLAGPGDLEARAEAARALVRGCELPPSVARELAAAYAELSLRRETRDVPVAVRSSATAEDLAGASFAGEYETYLWQRGADAVEASVRRCWASLYGARAIAYRDHAGLGSASAMAVVVQEMVSPRAAGVLFTLNPRNGDRSKIAIESTWGLGEALVAGNVTPDAFLLDKITGEVISRSIRLKERELVFDEDAGSGVRSRPVASERQDQPSLDDEELAELRRLARTAEKHVGSPIDMEWAVTEGGEIHVLQVRAETAWSQRVAEPVAAAGSSVLDHVVSGLLGGGKQ